MSESTAWQPEASKRNEDRGFMAWAEPSECVALGVFINEHLGRRLRAPGFKNEKHHRQCGRPIKSSRAACA